MAIDYQVTVLTAPAVNTLHDHDLWPWRPSMYCASCDQPLHQFSMSNDYPREYKQPQSEHQVFAPFKVNEHHRNSCQITTQVLALTWRETMMLGHQTPVKWCPTSLQLLWQHDVLLVMVPSGHFGDDFTSQITQSIAS